jgi:endonuclease YncB( thermonuclease family)
MVFGALFLTGCALPEVGSGRDVLEPLHSPVTPDVLTRQAAAPVAPPPETATNTARWRVSNVLDGRTLEIYQGLDRATATLGGIDVPTDNECLAGQATDSLAFITGGGRAFDVSPPTPRNDRIDGARVTNEDGEDLAALMLSLGLARVTDDAAGRAEVYDDLESAAREAALGIWSDECAD